MDILNLGKETYHTITKMCPYTDFDVRGPISDLNLNTIGHVVNFGKDFVFRLRMKRNAHASLVLHLYHLKHRFKFCYKATPRDLELISNQYYCAWRHLTIVQLAKILFEDFEESVYPVSLPELENVHALEVKINYVTETKTDLKQTSLDDLLQEVLERYKTTTDNWHEVLYPRPIAAKIKPPLSSNG